MHKLIKKYQGGGLTPPTYAPSYNSASDFYNNIMNKDFSNIGNSFINAVQPNLNFQSKMGDMTALSLLTNQNLSKGIDGVVGSGGGSKSKLSLPSIAGVVGQVASAVSDAIPSLDKNINSNDQIAQNIRNGTFKTMMSSGNPALMMIGAGLTGIDKTGGFTDASKGLGGFNDTVNMMSSLLLPGAGWFTKKTRDDYTISDTLKENADAYGGTLDKANKAMQNAGAKLIAGRGKANAMLGDSLLADTKVQNIMAENEIAQVGASNPFIALRTQNTLNGGPKISQKGKQGLKLDRDFAKKVVKLSNGKKNKIRPIEELIQYAKQQNPRFIQRLSEPPRGIKFIDDNGNESEGSHYLESAGEYVIPRIQEVGDSLKFFNHEDAINRAIETGNYLKMSPEEAKIFAKEYKQGWPEFFKRFKNGGAVNVIPDGALHKNKHHLENVDEKFEDVTAKGIPVITEGKGGDITQHAEVEREEIIFNLDVTKQLEKLMEVGSDEAAIEAGKLLVHEILENTVDNTGLLNKID